MKILKEISKYVQGLLYVAAGVLHFVNPEFYLKIMPPYLPWHELLVAVSGVCEIALGVLLIYPRTTRLAAWGIIALLIAVFPANIHLYLHPEIFPDLSPTLSLARLPLQALLILWAWWHTRGQEMTTV